MPGRSLREERKRQRATIASGGAAGSLGGAHSPESAPHRPLVDQDQAELAAEVSEAIQISASAFSPFYERNLFWGPAAAFLTLWLAGLGFALSDHAQLAHWLFGLACPFAAVASWCAICNKKRRIPQWGIATFAIIALAFYSDRLTTGAAPKKAEPPSIATDVSKPGSAEGNAESANPTVPAPPVVTDKPQPQKPADEPKTAPAAKPFTRISAEDARKIATDAQERAAEITTCAAAGSYAVAGCISVYGRYVIAVRDNLHNRGIDFDRLDAAIQELESKASLDAIGHSATALRYAADTVISISRNRPIPSRLRKNWIQSAVGPVIRSKNVESRVFVSV